MIPRFLHTELGNLLIRYGVYVRPTEEFFASKLWGRPAYEVLHTTMFWHGHGKRCSDAEDLGKHLKEATGKYLGVALGVQKWRHLAAAVGRLFMIIVDPDEQRATNMMDAGAGRSTTTSDMIYALEPGDLGKINTRILAKFKAVAALWQHHAFGLTFKKRVASIKEILHPDAEIGPDGLALHTNTTTGPGLSADAVKQAVEIAVGNAFETKVMPFIQQALQSQLGSIVEQAVSSAVAQVAQRLPTMPVDPPTSPSPQLFDVTMGVDSTVQDDQFDNDDDDDLWMDDTVTTWVNEQVNIQSVKPTQADQISTHRRLPLPPLV